MLPNNKRFERFKAWGNVVMRPLDWLQKVYFYAYYYNTTFNYFSISANYVVDDFVIGLDAKLYVCIENSMGNNYDNTRYFKLVNNKFVPAIQRLNYNGSRGVMEWVLNYETRIAFRSGGAIINPPFQNTLNTNDRPIIYIENNTTENDIMFVGETDTDTQMIPLYANQINGYVGESPTIVDVTDFTIYYKNLFYPQPTLNFLDYLNEIERIADQLKVAGLIYNLESY
jgi:hypothetical protein